MMRNVDAQLAHCCYRFRAHSGRRNSRTHHLETIPRNIAQQTFGHLTPRRVAGAEYQNAFTLAHVSFLSSGTITESASFGNAGTSQRNKAVATKAPASWATMKAGVSTGLMPAKVSLAARASVT